MAAHNDAKMPGRGAKGKGGIELYSPTYFAACALGGVIACGPTHTCLQPPFLRPLDVTDAHNSCHTVRPRELSPWSRAASSARLKNQRALKAPNVKLKRKHHVDCQSSRSNAAVKSTQTSTPPTSKPGAPSTPKKAFAASSSAGPPPSSATPFKAPANTASTKSSRTFTARECFQTSTEQSSTSAHLPAQNLLPMWPCARLRRLRCACRRHCRRLRIRCGRDGGRWCRRRGMAGCIRDCIRFGGGRYLIRWSSSLPLKLRSITYMLRWGNRRRATTRYNRRVCHFWVGILRVLDVRSSVIRQMSWSAN